MCNFSILLHLKPTTKKEDLPLTFILNVYRSVCSLRIDSLDCKRYGEINLCESSFLPRSQQHQSSNQGYVTFNALLRKLNIKDPKQSRRSLITLVGKDYYMQQIYMWRPVTFLHSSGPLSVYAHQLSPLEIDRFSYWRWTGVNWRVAIHSSWVASVNAEDSNHPFWETCR